jgi:Family of unknown function (DUF6496)
MPILRYGPRHVSAIKNCNRRGPRAVLPIETPIAPSEWRIGMARKYARSASKDVEREMRKYKRGTLKSGKGGKGGKVKSRKQAIAIGLSEARRSGKRVPSRATGRPSKASRSRAARKGARTRKRRGA